MIDGLAELIAQHAGRIGTADNATKMQYLNSIETDDYAVDDLSRETPMALVLGKLSIESKARLYDWMEAGTIESKAFKLIYQIIRTPDMAHPEVRGTVISLAESGIITDVERDTILRLGERKQSLTEQIFGHRLALGDFES